MDQLPEYLVWILIAGGVLTIAGPALLIMGRIADRQNYIIQKATPMPLNLVNVRDDVWLAGTTQCDKPLITPHFDLACVQYEYTLEERVRKTRTDSEGRTTTEETWKTRERKKDAAAFSLVQGEDAIRIDVTRAEFRHLESKSKTSGKWRHSVSFFPYPGPVNAIGSVSEKRERLEPYANIPLIVTSLGRREFLDDAEKTENLLRWSGFFCLCIGVAALIYGYLDYRSGTPSTGYGNVEMLRTLYALLPALLLVAVWWGFYKFNALVTLKHRTDNAWRQVDVDLKMRHTLIPQLVSVVKQYMEHEQQVLALLTTMRGQSAVSNRDQQIADETALVNGMRRMRVTLESYPDVDAQPVMKKLSREIKAIEEKIAHGRSTYNDAVMEYNTAVESFPDSMIAGLTGFAPRRYFPTS